MYSAEIGYDEGVSFLIKSGADIKLEDVSGFRPLFYAIKGNHLSTMKLIIEEGDNIITPTKNGVTPLMQAEYYGASDIIPYILAKNVNVNDVDDNGYSALTYAAIFTADTSHKYNPKMMEDLIAAGSDSKILDKSGRTIANIARSSALGVGYERNKALANMNRPVMNGSMSQNAMQMSSANFSNALDNMMLTISVNSRIKKIEAVLNGE